MTLGVFYNNIKDKHNLIIFNKRKIIKQIPLEEIVKEYGVEEV